MGLSTLVCDRGPRLLLFLGMSCCWIRVRADLEEEKWDCRFVCPCAGLPLRVCVTRADDTLKEVLDSLFDQQTSRLLILLSTRREMSGSFTGSPLFVPHSMKYDSRKEESRIRVNEVNPSVAFLDKVHQIL